MRRVELPPKNCIACGTEFTRESCGRVSDFRVKKYCSPECAKKDRTGPKHYKWKGGVKRRPDGYLRYSNNEDYVHRRVYEQFIGRKLRSDEHVHHINGNKSDNRIENLELHTNSSHRKEHCKTQPRNMFGRFIHA